MKKLFSTLIALMLIFSVVTVSAAVPGALSKVYTNYTCDYSFSMSFESSEEIVALLEELEMPDEINNYVDLKALLKSVLSNETKSNVQVEMSEDFKRVKMGITADSAQKVNVNKNLNIAINSKLGMWLNLDLAADEPVFEIIYSAPVLNRYMYINVFDMAKDDNEKKAISDALNSAFNAEYLKAVTDYSAGLLEKYADIKTSGTNCTIKIDNDGFTAMIDDILEYVCGMAEEETQVVKLPDEILAELRYDELPKFSDMKILGEEGITIDCKIVMGNITMAVTDADISVNIADIYTATTGEEWLYESDGILKFRVREEVKMSNMGKTKVEIPELTDENSFSYADVNGDGGYYAEDEEYEPEFPNYYIWGYTNTLPVVGDKIYLPLRAVLEGAYEENVDIGYDNGVITITSDYFDTIVIKVDSDKATIGGTVKAIDKVIKTENTVYVSAGFFEENFGWSMGSASYDMIEKEYYYSLYAY